MRNKIILILCLIVPMASRSIKNLGNPDEWGPYFEGDMRVPENQTRNGIIDPEYRWPKGVVPYTFHSSFGKRKKAIAIKAMKHYASITRKCIRFVKRTTQSDYITFASNSDGCWSYVGRNGGQQIVNLADDCLRLSGVVQHEIYHALGFFHEQSRHDREDYVTILKENIIEGLKSNFMKQDKEYASPFEVPYDYMSVMHYSAYAFSKNGKMTIKTKDPEFQNKIGQRIGLSKSDIAKLLKMYKCEIEEGDEEGEEEADEDEIQFEVEKDEE